MDSPAEPENRTESEWDDLFPIDMDDDEPIEPADTCDLENPEVCESCT